MTKTEFVKLMNQDLKNELKHMMFYLFSSFNVTGLGRVELQEFLLESAKDEMEHVQQFAKFIIDLGGTPEKIPNDYPFHYKPENIIKYAIEMEDEVVHNYTLRLHQCDMLGSEDGTALRIFYEDQILDSRTDANELRQMYRPYMMEDIRYS